MALEDKYVYIIPVIGYPATCAGDSSEHKLLLSEANKSGDRTINVRVDCTGSQHELIHGPKN